jgi:hypothetical protein
MLQLEQISIDISSRLRRNVTRNELIRMAIKEQWGLPDVEEINQYDRFGPKVVRDILPNKSE